MTSFIVDIYTPYKHYLRVNATFLSVYGEEYVYGIMPGHAPLISKVKVSKLKIVGIDGTNIYSVGGGVLQVDNAHNVTLLLNSIESKEEIDLERATNAKERAENRIAFNQEGTDIKRAKMALVRALNRIDVANS